jgi:hypothetical protein
MSKGLVGRSGSMRADPFRWLTGFESEIVGAVIGNTIYTSPRTIAARIDSVTEWVSRKKAKLMVAADLGPKWQELAESPALFVLKADGSLAAPPVGD